MGPSTVFTLTVTFSLITGTAAGVLSLLTWEVFRHTPFGRAVFALTLVLVFFIMYHALLLFLPAGSLMADAIKSLMFTNAAAFIWLMAWSQYRLQRRSDRGATG